MNPYEQSVRLLRLCPIPQSIQQLIYYILIGYGTPTTNALQTISFFENYTVRFAIFSPLNRNRLSLNAMCKKISYYYENPSHFSRYTLYELHIIYLNVNKSKNNYSEEYMITRNQDMQNLLRDLTKKRLMCLIAEEPPF